MATREFKKLQKNIELLKSHFLSFEKRTDGAYTENELLNCRAYVAFVHAEFETYFETVAARILARAKKGWLESKKSGKVIAGLVAFRPDSRTSIPADLAKPGDRQSLDYCVGFSIAAQERTIESNNGIRPENFAKLFSPLGLSGADVDEALSIQLDNFGRRRGGLVHSGAQVSLPRIRDPFDDEESDVTFLLSEVATIDEKLAGLR